METALAEVVSVIAPIRLAGYWMAVQAGSMAPGPTSDTGMLPSGVKHTIPLQPPAKARTPVCPGLLGTAW